MPENKTKLHLLNWSSSGILEIRKPLGWAKSEISGNGPEIQQIYGLGMFWKLENGLWLFKESFYHVTSGIAIPEEQEDILGILLSTFYPLILWVRNTEMKRWVYRHTDSELNLKTTLKLFHDPRTPLLVFVQESIWFQTNNHCSHPYYQGGLESQDSQGKD